MPEVVMLEGSPGGLARRVVATEARAALLTAVLKPYGIRTGQVPGTTEDGRGANRRGITRGDITQRDQEPGTPASQDEPVKFIQA